MNQTQVLLRVLYRTEKSALAMLDKELAGAPMEPQVAAVYEQKKARVASIERQLNNKQGASN